MLYAWLPRHDKYVFRHNTVYDLKFAQRVERYYHVLFAIPRRLICWNKITTFLTKCFIRNNLPHY